MTEIKQLDNIEALRQFIIPRYSCRSYNPEKDVEPEKLGQISEYCEKINSTQTLFKLHVIDNAAKILNPLLKQFIKGCSRVVAVEVLDTEQRP